MTVGASARDREVIAGAATVGGTRGQDLVLSVTAACRTALPAALALAAHTFAVTTVSRGETQGGSSVAPLAALATTGVLAWELAYGRSGTRPPVGEAPTGGPPGHDGTRAGSGRQQAPSVRPGPSPHPVSDTLRGALTLAYAATSARPLFHAALNPSPALTQRAVGGGIRAMIPLQATLAARAGAPVTALLTAALAPAARTFARKVSVT
ncbi:hypothetical protein [Streptomyces sp. NPDC058272]|uniref:hypothetical protein n=1 Tax=Streptomyces sp. NPDC058272 TaxID=3346415 RepID=UPI0036EA0964